jgi:hypothetical protein
VGLSVVGSYDGGLRVVLGFTAVDLDLWCPATQSQNVSAFHHAVRRHDKLYHELSISCSSHPAADWQGYASGLDLHHKSLHLQPTHA